MPTHCPFCNAKNTAAIGAVAFTGQALVEHHCGQCGHLFCITDRRIGTARENSYGFHYQRKHQQEH